MSDDRDENAGPEYENSAHGSAEHEVTLEQDGVELTEAEAGLEVEHAPGGGHPVPSFRDVDAEERAERHED